MTNNNNDNINYKASNQQPYFTKAVHKLDIFAAIIPFYWLRQWFKRRFFSISSSPSCKGERVHDGFYYLEAPRFHNGFLYCSDMHDCKVYKIDPESGEILLSIPFTDKVSGLGWLSSGELLVVSMEASRILIYNEETRECQSYADLAHVSKFRCNDMVVDVDDCIYVGNFGFDFDHLISAKTTTLVCISPNDKNREVSVGTTDMFFPNGSVITPDGNTLIVAETFRGQLTAFNITRTPITDSDTATTNNKDNGNKLMLTNRRIWANVGLPLDGICLDAEGCVWAAVPKIGIYETSGCVLRIAEDGKILECLGFSSNGLSAMCVAVNLYTDGNGQSWLYVMESKTIIEKKIMTKYKSQNSWITKIPVRVGPVKREDCSRYNAGMC